MWMGTRNTSSSTTIPLWALILSPTRPRTFQESTIINSRRTEFVGGVERRKRGASEAWSVERRAWKRLSRGMLYGLFLLLTSCTPKKSQTLLQPAEALGTVLAEETIRAAGSKKQIALIAPDANWGPVSTVEKAFKAELKRKAV